MDSKTEGGRKSHNHSKDKKTGPAAPPPPEPLQPMKLPPAHASKSSDSDGTEEHTPAETSLTKRLMKTVVDDGDVIEKNWVDKARKIAEAYRNDPHRQSEELSILRANYMDKRFGKTIKLSK